MPGIETIINAKDIDEGGFSAGIRVKVCLLFGEEEGTNSPHLNWLSRGKNWTASTVRIDNQSFTSAEFASKFLIDY